MPVRARNRSTDTNPDAISVVISTFERPDACERALRSVLDQTDPPLELLVCDNGSTDATQTRFQQWARRCEIVRYLRVPQNSGSPAPARNLGLRHAQGEWIAFLDDDDEWLAEKLAKQRAAIAAGAADVIATNAIRTSGGLYFPDAPQTLRPRKSDLLAANPIITSSVVVRRAMGEFPTARWLRGIEDYAAWLALADRGARFLVLGEPLVRYEDAGADRLSTARARSAFALARLAWTRAAKPPLETLSLHAALKRTAEAIYVTGCDGVAAVRARRGQRQSVG
jgi:glycosyltransferase involved in cell wall biosynthesis